MPQIVQGGVMRACTMAGLLTDWYNLQDLLVILRENGLFFYIHNTYFGVCSYVAQDSDVTLTLAGRADVGCVFSLTIHTEATAIESLKTALINFTGPSLSIVEVDYKP